jgi:hypothetical protein
MNQTHEARFQFDSLLTSLQNITESMATKTTPYEVKSLYHDGLQIFLQLKTLNHSFFNFEKEMTLPSQPNQIQTKLKQCKAEAQIYFNHLNKVKRESEEIESSLFSLAISSDFEIENINTELTTRIRLEKELIELKKNLKVLTTTKDAEEKKLDELKSKLKTFSEFSKPLNDYLSLGNNLKATGQNKQESSEPERTAYLSSQLPTPLFVLYNTLQQNILTYKKQQKLSVDIVENQPDIYFNELNIAPLSIIFRISTHRKKDCFRVVLTLKFDYLNTLDLVLVSAYSQRGDQTQYNEQGQKEERDFLNDLVKNDNGGSMPSSSKAFIFPTLLPLISELPGKPFNWVQALCGFSMSPSPSLSFFERVNYRPLGDLADYIPEKYLPIVDPQENKQDMRVDVDEIPVEIIEMDGLVDQGDMLMMQDSDFLRQEKDDEEDAKRDISQISDGEDSEAKNDAIQEEEADMAIDDSKISNIMHRRTGLTGDTSIVLNLVRMIKDHWWRNNS